MGDGADDLEFREMGLTGFDPFERPKSETTKLRTPAYDGQPTFYDVLDWLDKLEDISLDKGSRNLDNDLEMICACNTYLRRLK